jgi:LmbE family N-acetylglucosaminyl deacetylase
MADGLSKSMGQLKTPEDIRNLGTILCVWAHPDDESFSCAGIMAAAVKNGQKVICVTATKGESGVQDESRWPASRLGEIRAKELRQALDIIGINEHYWLGYHDGECEKISDEEGTARIREFIEKYQPDSILTFGPEGMTGHPDHQTVSRWATLAAEGTPINIYHAVENQKTYDKYMKDLDEKFDIYFNIDKPPLKNDEECDIVFCLTPELITQKFAALKVMPSQTERLLKVLPEDELKDIFRCECYVKADN